MLVLMAGLALWLLIVIAILGVCRAASRADDHEAARRLARTGRRHATVGLAAVAVTLPATPGVAHARPGTCANRGLAYQKAPARVRAAIACELDRVRMREGLRRLRDNRRLELAARRHSRDMVRRDYFSHVSPSGSSPEDRARRTGYARNGCSWRLGEVLAWGTARRSTAAATVRAWLRSPGHRAIVLSRSYAEGGVGTRGGTPAGHASGVTVTMVVGRRNC
ncbi:MAG TPA: CAP domain-containing protein [Solirubrobacteraceae bacterium]|jgi:uncharacterized protein YkwD|nr:CAP domain-containing protein [Solirubrobacteraceae bacterium]